ncbi:MAG: cell division protein ZapA [Acidobacteria bacterium]|nr:cell division protein ZapA [Acidobacteriota bacterium]MCZ6833393.1 cell division protein ZapA [Acidobacteriota bacterium]
MADEQDSRGKIDARIQVEIAGRTYTLRGNRDAAAVRELAGFVDERMREISARTNTADTTRVAILAALNIADELFKDRAAGPRSARQRPLPCAHKARDTELCRILDAALAV